MFVKKPDDGTILKLIDEEYARPAAQAGNCKASPVYRCPYRRYKTSTPRAANAEFLSEKTVSSGRTEQVDAFELVDPDGVYLESRLSECTAPSSYRCVHRQINSALPAAHVGMLHEIGSMRLNSHPLRLVLQLSEPSSSK